MLSLPLLPTEPLEGHFNQQGCSFDAGLCVRTHNRQKSSLPLPFVQLGREKLGLEKASEVDCQTAGAAPLFLLD